MRPRETGRFGGKSWQRASVIIILALFLHLNITGCVSAEECRSFNPFSSTNYNPREKMCCAGVLHPIRQDIQPYGCCGQGLYNSAVQDCCDGQILDRAANLKCCAQPYGYGSPGSARVYDSDNQICCQGTLAPKTEGAVCCGSTVMDAARQTCCYDGRGYMQPRDGLGSCCGLDKLYNASQEICCERRTGQDHLSEVHYVGRDTVIDEEAGCCGLAAINTREQHCCNQVPNNKTASNQCCGQTTYDLRSQVCCKDSVSELTKGRTECCDRHPFNPANQVCCGYGTIVFPIGQGSCCRSNPYSPVLASCCSGHGQSLPEVAGVHGCCGGQAYLKTDHLCCQGNLSERRPNMKCCGDSLYDTTNELCCNEMKYQRPTGSLQCCGSTSYDTSSETCCPRTGQVFSGEGLSCCYANTGTGAQAFDPDSQTCCAGRRNVSVYSEALAMDRCCGQSLLQSNQLCDLARRQPVNKRRPNHDAVCRQMNERTGRPMRGSIPRTYSREDEVCSVAGDLWMRVEGEEICGRSRYMPDSELCCGGEIYNKNDQYGNPQKCCGNSFRVYAPDLQCCFAGRIFNIPKRLAGICRQTIYNTNTSSCDRHGVVRPRSEVENLPELCGNSRDINTWTPYHPSGNECCGDVLIGAGQTCCNDVAYDTPGTAVGAGQCCRLGGGYNPDMHICCNGRLYSKNGPDMECCGGRPFEPTDDTQICCDDKLHSTADGRTLCTNGTVHSPQETVCDGVRYSVANGRCCGRNVVDDSQICCQGFTYSKEEHGTECCGKVAFDPSSEKHPVCCEGTLHRSALGLQCCGSQVIDPAQHQCCGAEGHRFAFARGGCQTCCGEAAGDYDPLLHTCCHGLLHKYLVGRECCGHDAVRDPSKEMCCGGVVQAKRYGQHTLCCKGYILDGQRFSCCGNVSLQRWTTWQQECCNGVVIDQTHQECVGGEVRDKDVEGTTIGTRRLRTRQTEHTQRVTRDVTSTANEDTEQITAEFRDHTGRQQSSTATTSSLGPADPSESLATETGQTEHAQRVTRDVMSTVNEDTEQTTAEFRDHTGRQQSSTVTTSSLAPADYSESLATEEPCSDFLARESAPEEMRCCGNLPYNSQNATCCRGIAAGGEGTSSVWSAVTEGVTNGSCCGRLAYDRSTAICCNREVFEKAWMTPDMMNGCCPSGQTWNRMREACEASPTYDDLWLHGSGMPPIDD